ncbi:MAG: hypothetical protein RR067_05975 [Bacilli bacterium]
MAYIPKEHKKYNLLPGITKNGYEVIIFDRKLMNEIEKDFKDKKILLKIESLDKNIMHYWDYNSYEQYFNDIDLLISIFPFMKKKLDEYKSSLILRNDKRKWGVLKYIGISNYNFTNNNYYYVPIYEINGKFYDDGIIDNEEESSVVTTTYEVSNFKVIIDLYGILKNKYNENDILH